MNRYMIKRSYADYCIEVSAASADDALQKLIDELGLTEKEIGTAGDWTILRAYSLNEEKNNSSRGY